MASKKYENIVFKNQAMRNSLTFRQKSVKLFVRNNNMSCKTGKAVQCRVKIRLFCPVRPPAMDIFSVYPVSYHNSTRYTQIRPAS